MDRFRDIRRQVKRTPVPGIKSMEKLTGVRYGLEISGLGKRFDTVIDCGLFHVFSDEERPLYVEGLSLVLVPGGAFRMLCFSEMEPGDWGPRRVTRREIREAFDRGWRVESIREARFETNLGPDGCRAWLSSIARE